jgi:hypothetical protein
MLVDHLNNSETLLLALAKIPGISGHPLHKGSPREVFIRDFLRDHLPADLAIGMGELIDSRSKSGVPKPQNDIILYKSSFPRIYLGGGQAAYLIESAVATIEVKSVLDQKGVRQAVRAAKAAKALVPSLAGGQTRPIANYIVAYSGPKRIETAFKWLREEYRKHGLSDPPLDRNPFARRKTAGAAVDGIFILGRGFCMFENNVGFINDWVLNREPSATWSLLDNEHGSLMMLFACLLGLAERPNQDPGGVNPYPYYAAMSPASITVSRIAGVAKEKKPVTIKLPKRTTSTASVEVS